MMNEQPKLKAFLSHKYNSPEVNLYFFNLFQGTASIEFGVDNGKYKEISVTRLELLIRRAHVFIGFFSISNKFNNKQMDDESLSDEAKYFKLEVDIALRLKQPMILFVDNRFGDVITVPKSVTVCEFDHQAVLSNSTSEKDFFKSSLEQFCRVTGNFSTFQTLGKAGKGNTNAVCLLLPVHPFVTGIYTKELQELIQKQLRKSYPRRFEILTQDQVINSRLFELLEQFDFIITDLNDRSALIPFFHGFGVPQLRLLYEDSAIEQPDQLLNELYGDHIVGYPSDLLRWNDPIALCEELRDKLEIIAELPTLISTPESALQYFRSAERRQEKVFISYSSENKEEAAQIIQKLNERFSTVDDYRINQFSISPGKEWWKVIKDLMARSEILILLLSPEYFRSKYCLREYRIAELLYAANKDYCTVFPINLDVSLQLTGIINNIQYFQIWEKDLGSIVKSCEELLDQKKKDKINEGLPVTMNKDRFDSIRQKIDELDVIQSDPLKLLFVSALPKDKQRIRIEFDQITDNLLKVQESKVVKLLQPVYGINYERMVTRLNEDKPNILHFAGHGDEAGLFFEREDYGSQFIDNMQLQQLFKDFGQSLSLVILSSCLSESQCRIISALNIYVIGFREEVEDTIATAFAKKFYKTFLLEDPRYKLKKVIRIGCTNFAMEYPAESKLLSVWYDGAEQDYKTLI